MERAERGGRGRKGRKKVCAFCADRVEQINYKDVAKLRRYLSERAKIVPRRARTFCVRAIFAYRGIFFFIIAL